MDHSLGAREWISSTRPVAKQLSDARESVFGFHAAGHHDDGIVRHPKPRAKRFDLLRRGLLDHVPRSDGVLPVRIFIKEPLRRPAAELQARIAFPVPKLMQY